MTAPTIVEYARYHQLTATPLKPEELITSLNALPIDGSQLKEWAAPVCDAAISSEKLQLSREGMQYLSQLSAPVQDVPWDQILDDPHRREKLRMEMPILIGDHEKDLRWFKKQMSLPKLLNDFRLDYNLDRPLSTECMELLDGSRKAADDCWKQCTQMRLDTSTAVLKVLSRSVSDDWTDDVLDGIYQTGLGKPTVCRGTAVTIKVADMFISQTTTCYRLSLRRPYWTPRSQTSRPLQTSPSSRAQMQMLTSTTLLYK